MLENVLDCYYAIDSGGADTTGLCTTHSAQEIALADTLMIHRTDWNQMPADATRIVDWEDVPVIRPGLHVKVDSGVDDVECTPKPECMLRIFETQGLFRHYLPLFCLPPNVTWEKCRL